MFYGLSQEDLLKFDCGEVFESLVLWLAEVGKKWEGASLGRTSEFCLVQMEWDSYEMLLCLYRRGMFSRLVWNSCEICLHHSQPCCCLSPCIPINFKISDMSYLCFLYAEATSLKSLSANVCSWPCLWKDNSVMGEKGKSLCLAIKQMPLTISPQEFGEDTEIVGWSA